MRGFGTGLSLLLIGGSWVGASRYFDTRLAVGGWLVQGEGPLWDSIWTARHIEAHGDMGYGWDVWSVWVDLGYQRLFAYRALRYDGKGQHHLTLRTHIPVALVRLPGRFMYMDDGGRLLPHTRPLPLPVIEVPRWDSTGALIFLNWWREDSLVYRLTSHLYQDPRGVWFWYGQIFPEAFVLGRTEDLDRAIGHWQIYQMRLQPRLGSHTCKSVLLHIPGQIVCQKN